MENPELPHVDRLVQVSNEGQETLLRLFEGRVLGLEGYELEKTDEDKAIIDFAQSSLQDYLSSFMSSERLQELNLPYERIYLLKLGGVSAISDKTFRDGVYSPIRHAVIVDQQSEKAQLVSNIFHELTHAYSYKAFQGTEDKEVEEYRLGLTVTDRSGKEKYLLDLNEGVSQYLSRLFFDERVKDNPEFSRGENSLDEEIDLGRGLVWGFFNGVVDEIYETKADEFKDRQEVIDIIVKATYDGNILRLGRLIESVYGKGGLRRMAQTAMYNS